MNDKWDAGFDAGQFAARRIAIIEIARLTGQLAEVHAYLKMMAVGDTERRETATRLLLKSTAGIGAMLAESSRISYTIKPMGEAA